MQDPNYKAPGFPKGKKKQGNSQRRLKFCDIKILKRKLCRILIINIQGVLKEVHGNSQRRLKSPEIKI